MRKFLSSHLKPKRTKAFIEAEKANILEVTKEAKKELAKSKRAKESLYVKVGNHLIPKKILAIQEKTRKLELLAAKKRIETAKVQLTPEQEAELRKRQEHEREVDAIVSFILNK